MSSTEREEWSRIQWDNFQSLLGDFSSEEVDQINRAYDLAEVGHKFQIRADGTPYFGHPRSVAVIIIDRFKLKDPNLVIGALMHDVGEDTSILGDPSRYGNSGWRRRVYHTLVRWFNPEVAEIVLPVTKPYVDRVEIISKEQAESLAIQYVLEGNSKSKFLKLVDRLHNIQTLFHIEDPNRRIKIANETANLYFPVFRLIEPEYPTIVRDSLEEMTLIINNLLYEQPSEILSSNAVPNISVPLPISS